MISSSYLGSWVMQIIPPVRSGTLVRKLVSYPVTCVPHNLKPFPFSHKFLLFPRSHEYYSIWQITIYIAFGGCQIFLLSDAWRVKLFSILVAILCRINNFISCYTFIPSACSGHNEFPYRFVWADDGQLFSCAELFGSSLLVVLGGRLWLIWSFVLSC